MRTTYDAVNSLHLAHLRFTQSIPFSNVIINFSVLLLKNTTNAISKLIDSKKTLHDVPLTLLLILLCISSQPGFHSSSSFSNCITPSSRYQNLLEIYGNASTKSSENDHKLVHCTEIFSQSYLNSLAKWHHF